VAGSTELRLAGGGAIRVVSFKLARTEICCRRVLPGTAGSTVAGVGRRYMRGCSGRRLGPFGRGSRERGGVVSMAGRTPEPLPWPLVYVARPASSAPVATAGSTDDDSPELLEPPSGLPKILVSSPNVEFLALSLSPSLRTRAVKICLEPSMRRHEHRIHTGRRQRSRANYHGCYVRREKVWIALDQHPRSRLQETIAWRATSASQRSQRVSIPPAFQFKRSLEPFRYVDGAFTQRSGLPPSREWRSLRSFAREGAPKAPLGG
jgi:hypothetical protein